MDRNYKRIGIIILGFIIALFAFSIKSYAGSISVSSPSTVEPGKSFTVTIKGNNATGKVTLSASNATLSKSSVWIEDSTITVTATAGSEGKATITATATDVSDSTTAQAITGSKSTSTEVKKKVETTPIQTPQSNNNSANNNNLTNNKKNNTTTKTTKTTETKKTETKIEETKEQEEATPQWGISSVMLTGIKDNEEKVTIELDENFDINTYEYSCNVDADVKKIELQKEAYEYNEFVTITGLEEDLKPGENIITLKLSKEGQQDLIYTIKINKEAVQDTEEISVETISEEVKEERKQIIVSMPLWCFILLEVAVMGVTVIITLLIIKLVKDNKHDNNNKKEDNDEENNDNKYEIIG